MNRLAVASLLAAASVTLPAAETPTPPGQADPVDVVFLAGGRPERVELLVEVDGRPVGAAWAAALGRLFGFADADLDDAISPAEAARLPSAFGVRQLLWGQIDPQAGGPPPFAELDADRDGRVSRVELAEWYRRAGVGGVTVGVGTAPDPDRLTDALVRALDADGDRNVTEAEWRDAPAALRPLDTNDDELVTPRELVAGAVYPGTAGTTRLTPAGGGPSSGGPEFPLVVLPADRADVRWAAEAARRTGVGPDRRGAISAGDLVGWRTRPAAATWRVRFGGEAPAPRDRVADLATPAEPTGGRVRLVFRADGGTAGERVAAAGKRLLAEFAAADADGDGVVTAGEAARPKPSPMVPVLASADRDGDGRLSRAELGAWLDVRAAFAASHVLITVLDLGRGLFEVLDADRDGALSPRELRSARGRVRETGSGADGGFDRRKLPRQFLTVVSRGPPSTPLGRPPRGGPGWFRSMDRNGDGDVSTREFPGPVGAFRSLDRDGDGLIDAREAEGAAPARPPGR